MTDKKMIADINECHTGLHDCDENAFCINTVGSFTCSCNPSFFGNGRDCRSKIKIEIAIMIIMYLYFRYCKSGRSSSNQ